jgi:hypothetical protein
MLTLHKIVCNTILTLYAYIFKFIMVCILGHMPGKKEDDIR